MLVPLFCLIMHSTIKYQITQSIFDRNGCFLRELYDPQSLAYGFLESN